MDKLGWTAGRVRAAQDDGGSANPDPTMKHAKGNLKGENMPPAGGESISPADSTRPSRPNKEDAGHAEKTAGDDDAPSR